MELEQGIIDGSEFMSSQRKSKYKGLLAPNGKIPEVQSIIFDSLALC